MLLALKSASPSSSSVSVGDATKASTLNNVRLDAIQALQALDYGTEADIKAVTPIQGQTALSTDTKKLFTAFAAGSWIDILGIKAGVLNGLVPSNNATDANNDIDVTSGKFFNVSANKVITLASALTKQLDAVWAVGTNAGGLFSGTKAADTWYHLILIEKDSDGSVDWGFDTSSSGANAPTGWTARGRFGSVNTDGSSNIRQFFFQEAFGGYFRYKAPILDVSDTTGTVGTYETATLTVPTLSVVAHIYANSGDFGAGESTSVRTPGTTDSKTFSPPSSVTGFILTNSSSQVEYTQIFGSTWHIVEITTIGWIDPRGRDQ